MAYLLNTETKIAHQRPTHEECNADQIKHKRSTNKLPPGYALCEHCWERLDKEGLVEP